MDLDTVIHQMVATWIDQNHSHLVEVDDVVLALEHMFPDLSEAEITSRVVSDVERQDGTIAWIGHA